MKKILIVEDEKPLARALELKLSRSGFDVVVAYNGEEALEYFKSNDISLILLDLVMPKMDGFAVLSHLKALNNHVPIIVTSNLSQDEDRERAKSLGATEYLVKSDTSLATIISFIQTALSNESR